MNKHITITGNIGSGKSTVTEIFKEKGYEVISADVVSSGILQDNQQEVADIFKINTKNFLDFKKVLGGIVFENSNKKQILEHYMIPKIYDKIESIALTYKNNNTPFVMELPTLFETRGLKEHKDLYIINVIADQESRFARIQKRNKNLSNLEIKNRMSSQINPEKKIQYSSVTIENNADYKTLKEKVSKLIESIENSSQKDKI